MNPPENKGNGKGRTPSGKAGGSPRTSPADSGNGKGVKKVAALRNAVERGRYRVDPVKVADKMVRDAVREIRSRPR